MFSLKHGCDKAVLEKVSASPLVSKSLHGWGMAPGDPPGSSLCYFLSGCSFKENKTTWEMWAVLHWGDQSLPDVFVLTEAVLESYIVRAPPLPWCIGAALLR